MKNGAQPKPKRGFMDCYEREDRRYDPLKDGFGHSGQWRSAFRKRMSLDEARDAVGEDSPFGILGVLSTASWNEIRSAYRRLARKWHPDICKEPNAEAMMKKINGAFTILEARFS